MNIVKPEIKLDVEGILRMGICWAWWKTWERTAEDGFLVFSAAEEDAEVKKHPLLLDIGLTLYLEEGLPLNRLEDGGCADACDRFIQYAAFGKLVYA